VGTRGHERVAHVPSWHLAYADLNARLVDPFLLNQILTGVECTLRTCFGIFARGGVPDHHEHGAWLLLHGESDVIQAGLGLVVDAFGPAMITVEVDMAEVLRLCNGRRRWNG